MPWLFSYGTLQQAEVQQQTFGRLLTGKPDTLVGYALSQVKITDPKVIETSGTDIHPILKATGNPQDRISGSVFELSERELERADEYEVDDYVRVAAQLESGLTAWIYTAKN